MATKKARFEICKSPRGRQRWWWRLVGGNGEIVCTSEKFPALANAIRSVNRATNLIRNTELIDAEIRGAVRA